MAADPRYLEAWKTKRAPERSTDDDGPMALPNGQGFTDVQVDGKKSAPAPPPSKPWFWQAAKPKEPSSATGKLQVRLDMPGGVTYSPSDLTSHNVIKRMFIPYTVGQGAYKHVDDDNGREGDKTANDGEAYRGAAASKEGRQDEYDFEPDLHAETSDPILSEARKYAMSINVDALAGRPEGGKVVWEEDEEAKDETADDDGAVSISGASRMTTASTRTTATMTSVATKRADSSLPEWYTRTSAKRDVAPFTVPSSYTATPAYDASRPWDAMRWHGHRAFERPSDRDRARGIAAFEDVNGPGRVPSVAESRMTADDVDDGASVKTAKTKSDTRSLNVADLFVIDPRISRPMRMVRRTDPRQVLLLCNGVYVPANEVTAIKAARAARQAGLDTRDLNAVQQDSKQAAALLAKLSLTTEARGGIGVVFCPSGDPLQQDIDTLKFLDPRAEINAAKRLEAAPTSARSSERRAQLRSALAAIELANWEEEGFDKIVVGCEQSWIVRGITTDIWRWRHTGWTLTEASAMGDPGEAVPDRDLWELLDEAVRKYEAIDCNVRFWHVGARDAALAKRLAHVGAMKDVAQRPAVVRWRKKAAPSLVEEADRRQKAEKERAAKLGPV